MGSPKRALAAGSRNLVNSLIRGSLSTGGVIDKMAGSRLLSGTAAGNKLGSISRAIAPGSGGAWAGLGAVPAPVLGLMGSAAAGIMANAFRSWQAKPEDRFPEIYAAAAAEEYKPREFNPESNVVKGGNNLIRDMPSLEQLAAHTKFVHGNRGVPDVSDKTARRSTSAAAPPRSNEAFVYKDKPYIMLSGDQARNLGFKAKGDRYGAALNRYQNARSALHHRRSVKAEEERGT